VIEPSRPLLPRPILLPENLLQPRLRDLLIRAVELPVQDADHHSTFSPPPIPFQTGEWHDPFTDGGSCAVTEDDLPTL
jgi:hypothetical protein